MGYYYVFKIGVLYGIPVFLAKCLRDKTENAFSKPNTYGERIALLVIYWITTNLLYA